MIRSSFGKYEAKISAFLSLLGGDAHLLTENEPIGSHELFSRLTSKEILTGEDESEESELKYLHVIKISETKILILSSESNIFLRNPERLRLIKLTLVIWLPISAVVKSRSSLWPHRSSLKNWTS